MTDPELAEIVARLEHELAAIPTPEEAERLRNEKQRQIHRYAKEQQRRAKKSMHLLSDSEVQHYMHGNGWMHQLAYTEHRHRTQKLIRKMGNEQLEGLSKADGDLETKVLAYEELQRRKKKRT
jgi:transcriptional regulator of heat shock response